MSYDVVVGGGSVAGLSFAAEAAAKGLKVLVLEEDREIGEPEKCDGLVSMRSMERYIAPGADCVQSRVRLGRVHSPSGVSATLDASNLHVVVIDRSAYEKQIAELAGARGASIVTSSRITGVREKGDSVEVSGSSATYTCSYYVDATGPAAILRQDRSGLIPAAKYEVEGDWFSDGEVEVFLDREKYPGFFAWVIPRGDGIAKVGAAGLGINSFKTLDSFLASRPSRIVTKVAAPIYVGGPVQRFVRGRTLYVGESAGQVKPTTAGGILASVAAGMMAATRTAQAVSEGDPGALEGYQKDWEARFGNEFRTMKRLRGIYEDLGNQDLEKIVSALSSRSVSEKLSATDFDFHATSFLSALGVRGTLQLASVLFSAEAKQVLSSLVQ